MDIFTTDTLNGVVAYLPTPASFLLDTFFPNEQRETTEEIHFDVENGKRRITPFVSPLVAGKVVEGQGFTAKTFKPAYAKDKRVFDANRPIKRAIGEQIGGNLTPMAAPRAHRRLRARDQTKMLTRRLETMASEAMRLGQVTVQGDQYPTVVVSYGRDAGLTVTLVGANRWGQAGIKPLDNLQDWALLVQQKSGTNAINVVMDVDAWKIFRADADVKTRLDRFRGNSTLVVDAKVETGGTYMGTIDNFNIWVYADWYVNDAGAEVPMLPSGTVLMGSASGIEGLPRVRRDPRRGGGLPGAAVLREELAREGPGGALHDDAVGAARRAVPPQRELLRHGELT
jgi:hypothetical protein